MSGVTGRTRLASVLTALLVVVCARVGGAQAVKGSLVGNK